MTRTMYDGVNTDAPAIGRQAKPGDLVAGYGDGLYAWSDADWANIPAGVTRVVIVVLPTTDAGTVLDCEPGNCSPSEAVDWVLMRRRAGVDPTVYCNQTNAETGWPAVRAAFQARGVREPHYWVADYDGVTTIPSGAVARQFNDDQHLGTRWDLSVVADYWPGIDPEPSPVTAAAATRRNDMHIDLQLNKAVVFTNPAAVLGGQSTMLLACDFGQSTVRVATFSFQTGSWTVAEHVLEPAGGALSLPLPADTNKVSVELTAGNAEWPVGLDVLA